MPHRCVVSILPVVLALGALGSGCGPTLRRTSLTHHWYQARERCSQGPFEVRLKATGAFHGESIALVAWAPRDIQGFYQVTVDGRPWSKGRFGESKVVERVETATGTGASPVRRWVRVERADNARCVAPRATEGAEGASDPVSGRPSPRPTPGRAAAEPSPEGPAAGDAARVQLVELGAAELAAVEARIQDGRNRLVFEFPIAQDLGQKPEDPWDCDRYAKPRNTFPAGADVRITFWSTEPNDLEGVVFALHHQRFQPSVSDAEWRRHGDEVRAKCLKRQQRELARDRRKAERRARREASRPARPAAEPRCSAGMIERSTAGILYRYWYPEKRPCRCFSRPEEPGCFGAGGYVAFIAKERKRMADRPCEVSVEEDASGRILKHVTRPCRCVLTPGDPSCFGPKGYLAFRAQELRRIAEEASRAAEARRDEEARRKTEEPTPPPPPRAEARPPSPSRNAEWVPGYWLRATSGWAWLPGWWRVPDRDVSAGLTTKSTQAPPAGPGAEARTASPVAAAVWTPGYWHFTGRGFVWVPGAWRVPPSSRHSWRPTTWRRTPGGAVLIPGGWVIR